MAPVLEYLQKAGMQIGGGKISLSLTIMSKKYRGHFETIHLPHPFDEEWFQEIEVELSDEEFDRLYSEFSKYRLTDEYKKRDCLIDDEFFLYKNVPDIWAKIREISERRALEIWGEDIRPHLDNIDIYVPEETYGDDEMWAVHETTS